MQDQDDRGAQVGCDLGVEGQLGTDGHVGVVGTENQHHLEPLGQLPESVNDDVQGLLGVHPGRVIAHAQRLVIGLVDPGLVDQQVNGQIPLRATTWNRRRRGQRPEHPDRPDLASQRVQEAQRHHRLAGQALGRGDVDAACHIRRLVATLRPGTWERHGTCEPGQYFAQPANTGCTAVNIVWSRKGRLVRTIVALW